MKDLVTYISEKRNAKRKTEYTVKPETRQELVDILVERLKEDKNANLNDIDITNVVDLYELFYELDPHKIDISEWDTSNAVTMGKMFLNCKNLEADLSKWDTSKVTQMHFMFCGCEKFNSDLSKWDVSKVRDMEGMFKGCERFKSNLNKWDVSSLEGKMRKYGMFSDCKSLKRKPRWY